MAGLVMGLDAMGMALRSAMRRGYRGARSIGAGKYSMLATTATAGAVIGGGIGGVNAARHHTSISGGIVGGALSGSIKAAGATYLFRNRGMLRNRAMNLRDRFFKAR